MTDVAQQSSKQNENRPAAFVQKLYTMIDSCDSKLATWSKEGDMFVIKDPKLFSNTVIPKYFIHNKFSSFARQLNFYGFRKVPTKPIRNEDYDESTAEHVIFHHPLFRKDREDLLSEIKRHSTAQKTHVTNPKESAFVATGSINKEADEEEVKELKRKVKILKAQLAGMERDYSLRVETLNREYLQEVKTMLDLLPPDLINVKTVIEKTRCSVLPSASSVSYGPIMTRCQGSQSRIVSSELNSDVCLGRVGGNSYLKGHAHVVGI